MEDNQNTVRESRPDYKAWEERRKEKMDEITGRLEEGTRRILDSDEFKNYLTVMGKFHHYSFRNSLLIFMQKPDATRIASYTDWNRKFHRQVRKGEKGIHIIAPAPYEKTIQSNKIDKTTGQVVLGSDGQPEKVERVVKIPRFKVVTVFDQSQTAGEPLPEFGAKELTASVAGFDNFMEAIRRSSPVPIRFDDIEGGAKGYYHQVDKEIVLQKDMPQAQTMKTAIHELIHSVHHDRDVMKIDGEEIRKDRFVMETEAEACAFCVSSHFGMDTGEYSFPYLVSWSSDRDMKELYASMDMIRSTSSEVIQNIETNMRQILLEQDVDRYEIYQIGTDSQARESKFMGLDELKKQGITVSQSNYDRVYSAQLAEGDSLDSLFEKFNIDQPSDFTGHSVSVSDVIVMHQNHEDHAYYVDSIGFQEIPEFFKDRGRETERNQASERSDRQQERQNHRTEKIAEKGDYRASGDMADRRSGVVEPADRFTAQRGSVLQALRDKRDKVNAELKKLDMAGRVTPQKRGDMAL